MHFVHSGTYPNQGHFRKSVQKSRKEGKQNKGQNERGNVREIRADAAFALKFKRNTSWFGKKKAVGGIA